MASVIKNTRKVLCIGRNYADHATELGNAIPKQPLFFLKPPSSALLPGKGPILRPLGTKLHYELELACIVGQRLSNLSAPPSLDAISGYLLALDLTARNVQNEAKSKGLPWTVAKGFDTFLPISEYVSTESLPDPHDAHLELIINGAVRQSDSTSLMLFQIPQILQFVSTVMTLEPGDIILTGTPKGVGEIKPGDELKGTLRNTQRDVVATLEVGVADRPGPYMFHDA